MAAAQVNGVVLPPSEPRVPDMDAHADDHEDDAEHEVDDVVSPKPKKKRRVVKTAEKKYECPHPECGKSYSRAEHLYRHQLNHTPKQIYYCDFPGCDRNFVRADLCARHKERHTAKGSHLQRKDAFLNSQRSTSSTSISDSPSSTSIISPVSGSGNHVFHATSDPYNIQTPVRQYSSSSSDLHNSAMTDLTPISTSHSLHLDSYPGTYNSYPAIGASHQVPLSAPADSRQYNYDGAFPARPAPPVGNFHQPPNGVLHAMQPPFTAVHSNGAIYAPHAYPSPTSTAQNFRSPTSFSTLPSMGQYGYNHGYGTHSNSTRSGSMMSPPTMSSADQPPASSSRTNSIVDFSAFDQMATSFAMPVFGSETPFSRSPPPAVDEHFLNMLFTTNGLELGDPTPSEPDAMQTTPDQKAPLPKLEPGTTPTDLSLPSLSQGFNIDIPQSAISEETQQRLLKLVRNFRDIHDNPGRRTKDEILSGNTKDPNHAMSLQMLKTYLASFWYHIHQQMPILHRPTFNPETCPDLLLLAMMCLGATCLERTHSLEMTQASAELAFFVAHHIRWEIFKDGEFRPPAKLWTFQSMLLLELFEKMFSTRSLHERGHVHHATTLTVMRRGSSLIGRSAIESSPGQGQDPTRTPPGPEGTINTSGQNTTDAYWNRWITAEATRRAAFAAFIIDSTHATLFGHSAIMSPHELRLPLPCDEALWSATSSAEVQRVEASLAANGFKTPSFLDGLRRTLNGQKVRTNTFGRVILMAGLLNVSWHMNQRDLQVSSLGAPGTLGSQTKWRAPLTRAFDFWRKDFDESMAKNDHWLSSCHPKDNEQCPLDHREIVFESRTCLHSLAHMAMHVDMIDCQVFAGADRAVGRMVTDGDRAAVQRRMREQWAPSARARDAVFYALRFLCEVMIPEEELAQKRPFPHKPPTFSYSPRHDYLLNRPWVLYFATLIVWSYGYALDGPIIPSNYTLTSHELQVHDMQRYLIRMGGVASPDDLERLQNRNSCLGLLLLLRAKFEEPRWELMHEASETLGSCIEQLMPGHGSEMRR